MYENITLKDLNKKHSFVYEIEGKRYIIGQDIFMPYCEFSLDYDYDKYKKIVENIGINNIKYGCVSIEKSLELRDCFKSVLNSARAHEYDMKDEYLTIGKELFEGLENKIKNDVLNQLMEFVYCYKLLYNNGLL